MRWPAGASFGPGIYPFIALESEEAPRSGANDCRCNFGEYRKLEDSRYTSQAKFPLASRKRSSSPPTAAAPHLARAAAIEIIKHRGDAAAVPVARDEPDPLPRRPSQAGRRPCREPRAVDDEIAAVRGLHDFDHVLLGRQIEPVLMARIFHLGRKGRRACEHGQRERRHPFEHDLGLPLVSRFRSSQALAARPPANFGIKGTLANL